MNFSFSAAPATRTSMFLNPWEIYKVKFTDAKIGERKNNKDATAVPYKVLEFHFEEIKEDGTKGGVYTETVFFPTEQSAVRPTYERPDGGSYQMPSSLERTMSIIAQVCSVLNPAGYKKMQEVSTKFKSFDDVANAVVKVLTSAKGKETHIKLVGTTSNGKVMANSPRTVALTKTGEIWTCDNFIGDNLSFSSYEEQKRKEYKTAAPVSVESNNLDMGSSKPANNATSDAIGDDFDLENLTV